MFVWSIRRKNNNPRSFCRYLWNASVSSWNVTDSSYHNKLRIKEINTFFFFLEYININGSYNILGFYPFNGKNVTIFLVGMISYFSSTNHLIYIFNFVSTLSSPSFSLPLKTIISQNTFHNRLADNTIHFLIILYGFQLIGIITCQFFDFRDLFSFF